MQRAALRATLLFLAISLAPPALAQADDGDFDSAWSSAGRAVTAEFNGANLILASERLDGSFEDRIEARLDPRAVSVELSYVNVSRANGSRTWLLFDVSRLIEYRDLDGDGRLDISDDFVSRVPLDDVTASSLTEGPVPGGGHAAVLSVPLAEGAGRVDVRLVMMPEPWTLYERSVLPAEVALEITLVGFQYTAADTRVAIVSSFEAPADLTRAVRLGDGFSFRQQGVRGFLEWNENATAGGGASPVGITSFELRLDGPEDAAARRGVVTFSYERTPASVRHTMVLGYAKAPPEQGIVRVAIDAALHGDWRLYTLGVGVAVLLVLATTARTLRRRSA